MHVGLRGLSKRFGSNQAVDRVDLDIPGGAVVALLGENGAGKSTLMKLLYGLVRPDAGHVEIDSRAAAIDSPRDAIALGIGMVFQQFSLIPALSVRENLALAMPRSPWWTGRGARRLRAIEGHVHALLPEVAVDRLVQELSVGQRQLVELAKVLLLDARCVILDEPSAVLTPGEAARLWQLMRGLAARGLSVVLITHKLNDVHACADEIAVMRGGRLVGQVPAAGMDDTRIVEWMIGHQPPAGHAPGAPGTGAAVRLRIENLGAGNARGVDLNVRAGEIVGIAGVSGNGQTALAEALAGVVPLDAGKVLLDGSVFRAPHRRAQAGSRLGYIPEQPSRNAVAPDQSLTINLALKRIAGLSFIVPRAALAQRAAALIAQFGVKPAEPEGQARWLSGGNLQKLVVARELADAPPVVVACYPTMGLDVDATAQVYDALFGLARHGSAVLWISEDLDDLLRYAHRIAVMLDGRVVRVLDAAGTSLAEVGGWMAGQPGAGAGSQIAAPAAAEAA